MPWKETCPMDEKLSFIAECLRGEFPMVALCEDYGCKISRHLTAIPTVFDRSSYDI